MWGYFNEKTICCITLEATIMNFLVLNPQVIPHRTGPSRLPMSAYRLVCLFVCLCAGYLEKLWTDSDETWWTGWMCGKYQLIQFW